MKIYRIVDNGIYIKSVSDELTALRLYYKIMQKNQATKDWAWIDQETV